RVHERDFLPGRDGLVFVARTGEPLKRGTFRARVWKPSLTRAGLPYTLRFHDLRHSYATWLEMSDVAFDASFGRFWEPEAVTNRVPARWPVFVSPSARHAVV